MSTTSATLSFTHQISMKIHPSIWFLCCLFSDSSAKHPKNAWAPCSEIETVTVQQVTSGQGVHSSLRNKHINFYKLLLWYGLNYLNMLFLSNLSNQCSVVWLKKHKKSSTRTVKNLSLVFPTLKEKKRFFRTRSKTRASSTQSAAFFQVIQNKREIQSHNIVQTQ